MNSAREWIEQRRGELVDDLRAYVSVETPSTDRSCLRAGLDWVTEYLATRLGVPAATELVDGGEYGDILVADYPGGGVGDGPGEPVALLCHYDTVWDEGTLADWPFQIDGDRMTGPGVFDMKAGLVQAVWALRALDAVGLPRPPVRFLLNGDEEIGSPASRPVVERVSRSARAVLVFEASASGGALKTARKGVGIWRLRVRGVEAHAGLDPTRGASAIGVLAEMVVRLHALTDLSVGTSVNVGVVHGGTRSNVIAGEAYGDLDVRVSSAAEVARIDAALEALSLAESSAESSADPRVSLELSGGWNRPVMERSASAELFTLASEVGRSMGLEVREAAVGGASDGNFAAALGCSVLDGLGAVGDGAHARHEHISLAGLTERSALAAGLLTRLAHRRSGRE